jgi:hypothetical protein
VIIRFKHQGHEGLQEVEEAYYMDHTKEIVPTRLGHKIEPPSSQFGLTKTNYHISLFPMTLVLNKYSVER